MNKSKKKILAIFSALTLSALPIFAIACTSEKLDTNSSITEKGEESKETNSSTEGKSGNTSELEKLDLKIKYNSFQPIASLDPSEPLTTDFKIDAPEDIASKVKVEDIRLLKPDYKEGTLEVHYKLVDAKNPKNFINKVEKITGFIKNPFGVPKGADISGNHKLDPKSLTSYAKKTRLERFDFDNENYMPFITPREGGTGSSVYTKNDLTEDKIKELDKKARENNQDSFKNAKLKGFSIPFVDEKGETKGLNVNIGTEVGKGPSLIDSHSDEKYSLGLARTLPNDLYKQAGLQTFSLYIVNHDKGNEFTSNYGTTWILDYQKRTDGKYPTKWYFATNVHVAEAMNIQNEKIYNTKSKDKSSTSFQFLRLKNDVGTRTTFRTSAYGEQYENWSFGNEKDAFKTIYMGLNFLKSSPKDYLEPNSPYKDTEEFIDFAVFEVDFEKLPISPTVWSAGKPVEKKYTSHEDLARDMTNNYADDKNKDKQIKFLSNSYLKDYNKIGVPFANNDVDPVYKKDPNKTYDSLIAIGYPLTQSGNFADHFLRPYIDEADLNAGTHSVSLWVNGRRKWYDKMGKSETALASSVNENEASKGNYLSSEIGYRSIINKPGLLDSMISNPFVNKGPHTYPASTENKGKLPDNYNNSPNAPEGFRNRYLGYGLNYMIRHFAPGGGASGTSVRNQNNELVGILHVSHSSALTSLAAAFRSEGLDYNKYYGPYNMEQYDLIYGGGENQRFSYREALREMYKENKELKTALFPDGLDDSKIPAEFKFKDKVKASDNPEK
ncbi:Ig-specific serine endopeptidase MIP [Mycoplasmopsis alligatoris]|uniref:Lipofamily protein n=1 Tax=Mycoplasmopsis alligatoris A21JP2 TaxID=747682 RepID=D4XVB7_9BACT|nr:DUF31 family protein [Mycoplasmopsis alligatoris]EFF41688.1 lipofamily protein [Mycoplasmopsis alligatoris A21JP2]